LETLSETENPSTAASQRKREQAVRGLDRLSYFVLCKLNDENVPNADAVCKWCATHLVNFRTDAGARMNCDSYVRRSRLRSSPKRRRHQRHPRRRRLQLQPSPQLAEDDFAPACDHASRRNQTALCLKNRLFTVD
jgi:hypothetical protein